MNQFNTLKTDIIESLRSIFTSVDSNDINISLISNLTKMIILLEKIKISDNPDKFDELLDCIYDSKSDIDYLIEILYLIEDILDKLLNILFEKYVPKELIYDKYPWINFKKEC